jgi:hypothetical protein
MIRRAISLSAVFLLCLAVSPSPLPAAAAPGGTGYALTWTTVDGGGGQITGGLYDLSFTVGQPDAWAMQCGDYPITGGFWNRELDESVCLRYLPYTAR